jgi:hypothetical protein
MDDGPPISWMLPPSPAPAPPAADPEAAKSAPALGRASTAGTVQMLQRVIVARTKQLIVIDSDLDVDIAVVIC